MGELIRKHVESVKGANPFLQEIFSKIIIARDNLNPRPSVWEDIKVDDFSPEHSGRLCMYGDEGILLVESGLSGFQVSFDAMITESIIKIPMKVYACDIRMVSLE